jgi:hypothetical protein
MDIAGGIIEGTIEGITVVTPMVPERGIVQDRGMHIEAPMYTATRIAPAFTPLKEGLTREQKTPLGKTLKTTCTPIVKVMSINAKAMAIGNNKAINQTHQLARRRLTSRNHHKSLTQQLVRTGQNNSKGTHSTVNNMHVIGVINEPSSIGVVSVVMRQDLAVIVEVGAAEVGVAEVEVEDVKGNNIFFSEGVNC